MKANRPTRFAGLISTAALAVLVASCASPPPSPAPPRPVPRPQPSYTPPPPLPPVAPSAGWRDAPITPGTWRWSMIAGASTARFGDGPGGAALEFRCDRSANAVLLIRYGQGGGSPLTVSTTSTARPVTGRPLGGSQPGLVVALPVRDALLDAIIFSRGRFAVEARGLAPVYAPTWPEIARVVEDCR